MTRTISHSAISASAGSGKTFQLAHRYIRLLAAAVVTFVCHPSLAVDAAFRGYQKAAELIDMKLISTVRRQCNSRTVSGNGCYI